MTEIKKKENSLPLMNEGLGELMCRRHFFSVFAGAIMRLSNVEYRLCTVEASKGIICASDQNSNDQRIIQFLIYGIFVLILGTWHRKDFDGAGEV